MTESSPTKAIQKAPSTNICYTPSKHLFMRQDSPYRNINGISTTKISVSDDRKSSEQITETPSQAKHIRNNSQQGGIAKYAVAPWIRSPIAQNSLRYGSEDLPFSCEQLCPITVHDNSVHLVPDRTHPTMQS